MSTQELYNTVLDTIATYHPMGCQADVQAYVENLNVLFTELGLGARAVRNPENIYVTIQRCPTDQPSIATIIHLMVKELIEELLVNGPKDVLSALDECNDLLVKHHTSHIILFHSGKFYAVTVAESKLV